MMIVNYEPDYLPKANEITRYTIQYEEKYTMEQNIDWIERTGQILCVVLCEDGLVVVMRETKGGAMPPFNVKYILDQ